MVSKIFQFRKYNLYHVNGGSAATFDISAGVVFKTLCKENLSLCPMAQEKNRLDSFKRRLEDGHTCLGHVDKKNSTVISYFWVTKSYNAAFDFGLQISVNDNETYIWDCRVNEDSRGQGLYKHGLSEITKRSSNVYIISEQSNFKSCRAIEKAGFRKILEFSFVKILKSVFFIANRRVKYICASSFITLTHFF